MLVNDCMPLTRPIPLWIRRASDETWVLLPRTTPPLSQYRKRTSCRPWASAWATISSGVIGMPRGMRAERVDPPVPDMAREPAVVDAR